MEDANTVRATGAELFAFPAEHIVRPQPGHRGDQVVLIHQGQTDIWPTIEAFRLDLLRDNQANIDAHIERRVQARLDRAVAEALAVERIRALGDHRRGLERTLARALLWAVVAAVVAFLMGHL
jgi:hypothetical protein